MISIEYTLPINCCAQLRLDGISQSQWSAVARLYCCCVSWFSKSRPLGFWLNFPCWCCWVQFYVDYLLIKFLAFFSWAFSELLQILEDRSTTQWFHNHALFVTQLPVSPAKVPQTFAVVLLWWCWSLTVWSWSWSVRCYAIIVSFLAGHQCLSQSANLRHSPPWATTPPLKFDGRVMPPTIRSICGAVFFKINAFNFLSASISHFQIKIVYQHLINCFYRHYCFTLRSLNNIPNLSPT